MIKVITKNGIFFFMTIGDASDFIVSKFEKIFANGAFVKICEVEDFEV